MSDPEDIADPARLARLGIANAVPWTVTTVSTAATAGVPVAAVAVAGAGAAAVAVAAAVRRRRRNRSGQSGGRSGQARSTGLGSRRRRQNTNDRPGTKNNKKKRRGDRSGKNGDRRKDASGRTGRPNGRSAKNRSAGRSTGRSNRRSTARKTGWTPGVSVVENTHTKNKKKTPKKASSTRGVSRATKPKGNTTMGTMADKAQEAAAHMAAETDAIIAEERFLAFRGLLADFCDSLQTQGSALTNLSNEMSSNPNAAIPTRVVDVLDQFSSALTSMGAASTDIVQAFDLGTQHHRDRIEGTGTGGWDKKSNKDEI